MEFCLKWGFIFNNYSIYIYEVIMSLFTLVLIWNVCENLQSVTFYGLYLRISKVTHSMSFIWKSPKPHVTWESLKRHVSQPLQKYLQSDNTHKLDSLITKTIHTIVSIIPKVFPKEKRHIPLALPDNHSLLLCGEMWSSHESTMGVGITGALA